MAKLVKENINDESKVENTSEHSNDVIKTTIDDIVADDELYHNIHDDDKDSHVSKNKGIMTKLLDFGNVRKKQNVLHSYDDSSDLGQKLSDAKFGMASEQRVAMDAAGFATGIDAFEDAQNEFDDVMARGHELSESDINKQGINSDNVNELINAASQGGGDELFFDDEGEEFDNDYSEILEKIESLGNASAFDVAQNENITDPIAIVDMREDPLKEVSFEFSSHEDGGHSYYHFDLSKSQNGAIYRIIDFNDSYETRVGITDTHGNFLSNSDFENAFNDPERFKTGNDGAAYRELILNSETNGEDIKVSFRFYGINGDDIPDVDIDNFDTSDKLFDLHNLQVDDEYSFQDEYHVGEWPVTPFSIDSDALSLLDGEDIDSVRLVLSISHGLESDFDALTLNQDGVVSIDPLTFAVSVNGRNIGFIDIYDNGYDGEDLSVNFNSFCSSHHICDVINAAGYENNNYDITEEQLRRLDLEISIGDTAVIALMAAVAVKPPTGQTTKMKQTNINPLQFHQDDDVIHNELSGTIQEQLYRQQSSQGEFIQASASGSKAQQALDRKREQRDNRLISMISNENTDIKELLSAAFLDDYEEMDKRELHNIDADVGLSINDVSNLAIVSSVLNKTSHITQKQEEDVELDDQGNAIKKDSKSD